MVRVAGDRVAELGGGAFDEGDRFEDIGERAHAIDEGQRAGFHRGVVRIVHPIDHIHQRGARPHGGGLDDDRRRGVGQSRGSHGEEDEWDENGFHGGAFETGGGGEPGSLGKDDSVFVMIRLVECFREPGSGNSYVDPDEIWVWEKKSARDPVMGAQGGAERVRPCGW